MTAASGNFEFLEKYDARVTRLARQAERYVHTDPDACMFKLRLMIEIMTKALVELQLPHLVSSDLSSMLRGLQRSGLLDRRQADEMHAIRRDGNAAVHGEPSTTPGAMRRLRDAHRLGAWYLRMIRRGAKVKLPQFQPPDPPPGVDSAVDSRRRAEMLEAAIEAETPSGERLRLESERVGSQYLWKIPSVREAGIWRLRSEGEIIDLFAVNLDTRESDLTPIDTERVRNLFAGADLHFLHPNDDLRLAVLGNRYGREFWREFLLLAIALMVLEQWIARVPRDVQTRQAA